ncbi:MAG: hypothetical protein ACE37I_05580 [Rubinisphaera brasiliensis]|uniref:hypothetical protein n=1 Tax=Rubinisphaera brasiliensis TaxID=119 RepID=UPI00391BDF47
MTASRNTPVMLSRRLCLMGILCLTSCGSYFLPAPTTRPVSIADLAGEWTYEPLLDDRARVLLELKPDNTYVQTVTLPQRVQTSPGRWQIEDGHIKLSAVLGPAGDWNQPDHESWRIIDHEEGGHGFAILGGAGDPDLWVILQREN